MAVFARSKMHDNKGLTVTDRAAPLCDRCREACKKPARVGKVYWCKKCVKAVRLPREATPAPDTTIERVPPRQGKLGMVSRAAGRKLLGALGFSAADIDEAGDNELA